MTNTPPTTAGTAWNIDYEAHGLLTGSPRTPTSTPTRGSTAESSIQERALASLSLAPRPRAPPRAYHVHSALQWRRQQPAKQRGCEEVQGFQLLRAHANDTRHEAHGT